MFLDGLMDNLPEIYNLVERETIVRAYHFAEAAHEYGKKNQHKANDSISQPAGEEEVQEVDGGTNHHYAEEFLHGRRKEG